MDLGPEPYVLTQSCITRRFPHKRVLVVAPHPDDELLGCGGLVATLAPTGTAFCFVFVTDGGASHLGSRTWPRERLMARRRDEAIEALRRLNGEDADITFLRCPTPPCRRPVRRNGTKVLRNSPKLSLSSIRPWLYCLGVVIPIATIALRGAWRKMASSSPTPTPKSSNIRFGLMSSGKRVIAARRRGAAGGI